MSAIETPMQIERPTARAGAARLFPVAIIVLWAVIYVPGLFQPALLDDADSVHAEAAREMVLRGDWVTLHANGVRYLEKAPFMYWTIATSFKLFGVAEWSARLPVALGTLALLLAVFALGRRTYDPRAGFYAAIVLATGFGPYIFTRILLPDLLVALWLTLGLHFFLKTLESERPTRLDCWALAITAALNVLTKGLIGLVFPCAIIVVFLLLTGNLKHLLRLRLLSSAMVFLAVAAPWHILAGLRNPAAGQARGFFWFYFVNEHFLRYLNKREPRDYGTVPLLVFWGLVLGWVMPWAMFAVQAIARVPHRFREFTTRVRADRRQSATLLFAVWLVVIVGFFSFSTRQEYYSLPALPALALLLGQWLSAEVEAAPDSRTRCWGRVSSTILFVVAILAAVAAVLLLRESVAPHAGYDIADLLNKNPEKYALSFGHVFDLTPEAMGAFRLPLAGFATALVLGCGLNWILRRRGMPAKGNFVLAAMMAVVLFCVHLGLIEFSPVLTSKPLALAVKQVYQPGDAIVIDAEYEPGSTMNFYTGQQVHVMNKFGNLWYGSFFPDTPQVYQTPESLRALWDSPRRVFLWSESEHPQALEAKPARVFAKYGGKYIYTNR